METKQLIEASARVVTIATVRSGDIYKRLEKVPYGDTFRLVFGQVTDVMNNGETSAITAVEFVSEYGSTYEPQMKVFGSDTDLALFPATVDEFMVGLIEAHGRQEQAVESARVDLARKEAVLARMEGVIDSIKSVPEVIQVTSS